MSQSILSIDSAAFKSAFRDNAIDILVGSLRKGGKIADRPSASQGSRTCRGNISGPSQPDGLWLIEKSRDYLSYIKTTSKSAEHLSCHDLRESATAHHSIQQADEMRHSRSRYRISHVFQLFLWSYGRDWCLAVRIENFRQTQKSISATIFGFLIPTISRFRKTLPSLSSRSRVKGGLRNISSQNIVFPREWSGNSPPGKPRAFCGIRTFWWFDLRPTGTKTISVLILRPCVGETHCVNIFLF
jgi:hypothetical protein